MDRAEMIGKTYGSLTVVAFDNEKYENDMTLLKEGKLSRVRLYYLCECSECKKTYSIRGENLRSGNTKSCKCTKGKRAGEKQRKKNNVVYKDDTIVKFISSNTDDIITVDADTYDKISGYCWYVTNHGYAMTRDSELHKQILLHRLLVLGKDNLKSDRVVDHANRNPLDCRLCNLRICSLAENSKNVSLSRNNTSGVVGVSYSKQFHKWRAWVSVNGKYKSLGYYSNREQAVEARLKGERKYYGAFAPSLN